MIAACSHPGRHTAIALAIASASAFLLFSSAVEAAIPIIKDTVIDGAAPLDSYHVHGAKLTANGAVTNEIDGEKGSTIELNGSTVTGAGGASGMTLNGTTATLRDSTVTGPKNQGLNARQGSAITVQRSQISGALRGATLNESSMTLEGSELRGTNSTAQGAVLMGGTLTARDSIISGGQEGISMTHVRGGASGPSQLVLDGTDVIGERGSAIVVGAGSGNRVNASIDILNGSTLSAGNGPLVSIAADGDATLRVNASHLVGDIVAEQGGRADITLENGSTLKGNLENIEKLAINSQAEWTLTQNAQLNDLAMSGGAIRFGEAAGDFHTLSVANLEGSGTFIMDVDFTSGEADHLEVTGHATGDHQLLVSSSGSDPQSESSLHLVHTASGDARFALEGGPVDLGAYSYGLVQRGDDWFLDTATRTVSPGTQTLLGLFNATPTVWYGELTTLRSRMGEVRRDTGKAGGWIRSYGNKFNVSSNAGTGYQQTQQGLSFGADAPLPIGDGNWLAGVTAGYSNSDLNLPRGAAGTVNSYHLGAYTTWLQPQSGYYLDAVVKLNRYQNEADVRLSDGKQAKGDYDSNGLGAALEFGRHLRLADGYFVEPYGQVSAMAVQGQSVTLDNGMRGHGDSARSLQAKLGSVAGRNFDLGKGRSAQPYLKAAVAHEFAQNNDVKVNDHTFRNDLSGTRGELGAGVSVAWAEQWQMHAEFDYSHGEKIEQPWGLSAGLRYSW
jgi:outer membrane autotransporter protein